MSIRFVCGPSGSGKSTYIRQEIINRSIGDPGRKFLLIVPDQFNMQAQMRMIEDHPDHAFSDIEVLSFSRLSHRILEETGGDDIPVLDDTGKSLIIRKVSGTVADRLHVMGSKLDRAGFIHEVKSAISEFMQYGITPDDLNRIAHLSVDRRQLGYKLHDLEVLYRAFMEFKADRFITGEETLDLVKTSLHKSKLIPGSFIAFDGFTGFTPIQENVIQELMVLAGTVWFSFTTEAGADPHAALDPEDMFGLSSRSVIRLMKLADQASVREEDPVILGTGTGESAAISGLRRDDLKWLERKLFRYGQGDGTAPSPDHIRIFKAGGIREEIIDTFQRIRDLIGTGKYRYRDIAVVVGDMSAYADEMSRIADSLDIPLYMDYSRSILMSPFVEALSSAYEVIRSDYTRESIIRHMRTGFGPLDREETDLLENFMMRYGIRGRSSFARVWTTADSSNSADADEAAESGTAMNEAADLINSIREKVYEHFASLHNAEDNVRSQAAAVYEFMSRSGMYAALMRKAEEFAKAGDPVRAIQYGQVFDRVCALLDQTVSLCGDEKAGPEEFYGIFEAGLGEIRLGIIPAEKDRIMVGDITRSRLDGVKVLFLLGANEGYIPGALSSGGLISDLDRLYLKELSGREEGAGIELAPTPRDQIFQQRLYLYMILSKPSDELILSYSRTDPKGKAMSPSYLIGELCKLFPGIRICDSDTTHTQNGRLLPADSNCLIDMCAEGIRRYTEGNMRADRTAELVSLCRTLRSHEDSALFDDLCRMSLMHYTPTYLSRELARRLYGAVIRTSVSRLESFAECAYKHFLEFGLRLRKRPEYTVETTDVGNLYHAALERFSALVAEQGLSWDGLNEAETAEWIDEITTEFENGYGDSVMISSHRNKAMGRRIRRVLARSVDTIRYQITGGEFVPGYFEIKFSTDVTHEPGDGAVPDYTITGKIDRVDLCRDKDRTYVRVIDYKSGSHDLRLDSVYHGSDLQLPVYLGEMLARVEDSVPAGMFYYHIDDPELEQKDDGSPEDIQQNIRKKLRMTGMVNSDPLIVGMMDKSLEPKVSSDIVPVNLNEKNQFKAGSRVCDTDSMYAILRYARRRMDELMRDIMEGSISARPCKSGRSNSKSPCEYCIYKQICRMDSNIPGYDTEIFPVESEEQVLEKMLSPDEEGNEN